MLSLPSLLAWLALFTATQSVLPGPELLDAERVLRDAKVPTDGPGLLAYVRAHTLSETDRARLAQTVRDLGAPSFERREQATRFLMTAGRAARPFLLPALRDPDPEISHRAGNCLQVLEDRTEQLRLVSAATVLAVRRPPGTTEALLAYLPSADEEEVEEAVTAALAATSVHDGKIDPAVVAAATDREPSRRAAAAFVLGKGAAASRPTLQRLLDDRDPKVRFRAADALVRVGERSAMPVLFALLDDAPSGVAYRVEDLLLRAGGDGAPNAGLGAANPAQRQQCRVAWETWWKAHGDQVDLTRVNREEAVLGLTVICEYDGSGPQAQGRVWECGADGKIRWEFTSVVNPADVQVLSGGRILLAETGAGRVTERDRLGKILWEQKVVSPIVARRLRNGNTFVANYNTLFEFGPDGKQLFSATINVHGMIYGALKLRNGNYACITQRGEVTEVDPAGKEVRTFKPGTPAANGAGYWASIEELPRGHFLVTLGNAKKALEVDGTGKVVWECAIEDTTGADSLRNGHVLVGCTEGRHVIEYDRDGKEVWRAATLGRPFRVRRY